MKYTTYLFDFDYTLVDATTGIVNCFEYAFMKSDITGISREDIKNKIGIGVKEIFRQLAEGVDEQQLDQLCVWFNEKAHEIMSQHTRFLPYADEVVRTLSIAGNKVGIVSNKESDLILEHLVHTMMVPYVNIVVGSDAVEHVKPSPEGLEHAISSLKVKRNTILYVGDSEVDAQTAEAAGVDFMAVTTGNTTRAVFETYPHVGIIDSLAELLN